MIPFNKPYLTGQELGYIAEAHHRGQLAGDGYFTKQCNAWLEQRTGCSKALLTHSCTAALEMAALLSDIQPGDEVILPSYTFVSTANAFVLRGGVPIFVDIRTDTLNIDETLIEAAITPRTKVIVAVHYAGVSCEMDTIMAIARRHQLIVVEDAAQAILARYKGRPLGSIGDFGCYSFHETKNIISGEGGALLINNSSFADRAEIIREKGTNRARFFQGKVDKYSWVDIGSSYLPGELIAAFLWAQMEQADAITAKRIRAWESYYQKLRYLEQKGCARLPTVPGACSHNAHLFYLITASLSERSRLIEYMKREGIHCVFHYVPLHSSEFMANQQAQSTDSLRITEDLAQRLIRLPLWINVDADAVATAIESFYRQE